VTFREMRRKNQQLSREETLDILRRATSGVLALLGDGDYPYAVPLSHVLVGDTLYFHGAVSGHKADAAARGGKASFCVVSQDEVHPEALTTHFRSVIAFGRIRIVQDDAEKLAAIRALAQRFAPGHAGAEEEIRTTWSRMHLFALDMEHVTGKECIELTRMRN